MTNRDDTNQPVLRNVGPLPGRPSWCEPSIEPVFHTGSLWSWRRDFHQPGEEAFEVFATCEDLIQPGGDVWRTPAAIVAWSPPYGMDPVTARRFLAAVDAIAILDEADRDP